MKQEENGCYELDRSDLINLELYTKVLVPVKVDSWKNKHLEESAEYIINGELVYHYAMPCKGFCSAEFLQDTMLKNSFTQTVRAGRLNKRDINAWHEWDEKLKEVNIDEARKRITFIDKDDYHLTQPQDRL